jgi:hypothetical protein
MPHNLTVPSWTVAFNGEPFLRFELPHDFLSDHQITCSDLHNSFARARQSLNEVRTTDNSDHFPFCDNRYAFDAIFFEQRSDVSKECGRLRRDHLPSHEVFDSTGMRFDVFDCERLLALPGKYLQPPGAMSISVQLGASHQIAFTDDSDQLSMFVDNRESAIRLLSKMLATSRTEASGPTVITFVTMMSLALMSDTPVQGDTPNPMPFSLCCKAHCSS